jgi:hypothetical protein
MKVRPILCSRPEKIRFDQPTVLTVKEALIKEDD